MLRVTGNVLGVITETVHPKQGQTWDSFTRTTLHILDGVTVQEVGTGNQFDLSTLTHVKDGDYVDVEVELYKARLYAKGILHREPAAKAS
jgi:hypothetical protein